MTIDAARTAPERVPVDPLARGSRQPALLPGLLLAPTRILLLLVVVVPTIMVVWLSLTDWQPTQGTRWYDAELIGWWNFIDLSEDRRFIGALWRTLFVVVVTVGIEVTLGILLALLFLESWPWRKLALALTVLPMMIVPVDAANAFFMLFNDRGPINHLLSLTVGSTVTIGWLSDPNYALIPIILADVWQWTPLMFLLTLSAFLGVPRNQLRAAESLGASPARILLRVVLPFSLPILGIAVLVRVIEAFKIFDVVYILTRGGPGTATETLSMFMYNGAFVYFRTGYIAAAALVVLVAVAAICAGLLRVVGHRP